MRLGKYGKKRKRSWNVMIILRMAVVLARKALANSKTCAKTISLIRFWEVWHKVSMQLEVALSDLQSLCRDTTALSVVADTCQPCLPASPGAVCEASFARNGARILGHFVFFLLPFGRMLIAE